jgi:hypothetical protein
MQVKEILGRVFPPPYRHVISLGFFCSTALELKRYGFREASYPFDWVICPIEQIVNLLESDFETMLLPGHLVRDSVQKDVVHDLSSGIDFYHDFVPAFLPEEQLGSVRNKYYRRIIRFREAAKDRTLFVRYIASLEEHRYLSANMNTLLALLRRSNPANDLLLIGNAEVPPVCSGIEVYRVEPDVGDSVARRFASKNGALRWALLVMPYPVGLRLRNLARSSSPQRFKERCRARLRRTLVSTVGEGTLKRLSSIIRRS